MSVADLTHARRRAKNAESQRRSRERRARRRALEEQGYIVTDEVPVSRAALDELIDYGVIPMRLIREQGLQVAIAGLVELCARPLVIESLREVARQISDARERSEAHHVDLDGLTVHSMFDDDEG